MYQVLARKWRPKTFADLVGQEHVVKALQNALAAGRLHHAYLLTGTRGVGKTTIARILAKSLNCENAQHGEPCGQCQSCRDIDAGRFVDLLEIDAASNTGIDNIREVLENAQYAPTAGKYKVYIIDEVHMLSKSAFNAMLKTLEEPPEHVKFILATTDPHKVPVTVLSRCLQFVLRNMTAQQVSNHLAHILDAEQIAYEAPALALLGRAAQGSMRDALSLLDQAIAMGSGSVTEADTRQMIGAADHALLYTLLDALSQRNGEALIAQARQMAAEGTGFDNALAELALLLQRIALAQTVPAAIAPNDPESPRLHALAQAFSGEQIQLYYQCALRGKQDLPHAPDEYAGFIMTLLRMLAFAPFAAENTPRNAEIAHTQMHEPAAQHPVSGSPKTDNPPQGQPEIPAAAAEPVPPEPAAADIKQPEKQTAQPEHGFANAAEEPAAQNPVSGSLKTDNPLQGQPETPAAAAESVPPEPAPADIRQPENQTAQPEHEFANTAEEPAAQHPVSGSLKTDNPPQEQPETPAAATEPVPPEPAAADIRQPEKQTAQPEHEFANAAKEPAPAESKSKPTKKGSPKNKAAPPAEPQRQPETAADSPMPPFAAEHWHEITARIGTQVAAARMLLEHTAWAGWENGILHLATDPANTKSRVNKEYLDRIARVLSQAYAMPVRIQTQPLDEAQKHETPAMRRERQTAENRARAQTLLEQDTTLRNIQEIFGTKWIEDSLLLK